MFLPSLRRLGAAALAMLLLMGQALATWSIVVVNVKTGEICVASATCIENFNLRTNLAILSGEAGGGAAQSFVSPVSTRALITERLAQGVPPQEILDEIESFDLLFQSRQFGFVDLAGRAVTFSGSNDGIYYGGVTGQVGDLVYAIQGNVLTGSPVISEAENALRNTQGDLGQRVMAAMEAAQAMGGDGRCSCSPANPTSCGAPPASFTKSAHVGFLLLARQGDEPFCDNFGCAKGDLFMAINKASLVASDPDPVFEIRTKFDQERLALLGRPDAYLSTIQASTDTVPAGSTQLVSYVLDLQDIDGNLLTSGGATITMEHDPRSAGLATLQQVTDHQDGTYTVEILPGTEAGIDVLRLIVDDGVRPVTLWPPPMLLHQAPALAPLAERQNVDGLSNLGTLRAVFGLAHGLEAWTVADRGQGWELLQLNRPSLAQAFNVTADVGIANFALAQIVDLWVSEDGLRLSAAAFDPQDGTTHLYESTRATTLDDFDEPQLLVDLDSGLGERSPALSQNGLEIVFASTRSGQSELWHATRRQLDARWFPPTAIASLQSSADASAPTWTAEDTVLLFHQSGSPEQNGLWQSSRMADGSFASPERVAGVDTASPWQRPLAVVEDVQGSSAIWFSQAQVPGEITLSAAAAVSSTSLTLTPNEVSLTAGASLQLNLHAGASFAQADYTLFVGFADGLSVLPQGEVLPLRATASLTRALIQAASRPALSGMTGTLDALGQANVQWTIPAGYPMPAQLLDRQLALSFWARLPGQDLVSVAAPLRFLP